jgi:hypothetical protein
VIKIDDSPDDVLPADSVSLLAIKQLSRTLYLPKWKLKEKHYIAAVLDPRQKHRLHKFGVDGLVIAHTKKLLVALMREYATAIARHDVQQPLVPQRRKGDAINDLLVCICLMNLATRRQHCVFLMYHL